MLARVLTFCGVVMLGCVLISCGDGSSSSSGSSFDLTGTWQGTVIGAGGGTVTVTLDLTQVGGDISGTFACTSLTNCLDKDGTITGTFSLNTLTSGIVLDTATCPIFNATVTRATERMDGTFTCTTLAAGEGSGTWTATRQ